MGRPIRDLSGQKFGSMTAVRYVGTNKNSRALWECVCECGAERVMVGHTLTTSPRNKCPSCCRTTHGQARSVAYTGLSPAYISWQHMKDRCYNKNHIMYKHYGGRGVSVCKEWLTSFEQFFDDMGERPDGTTLDRIDSNGNYCSTNCRWSTPKEQARNRTNKKGAY
jgi:hypothetical protein